MEKLFVGQLRLCKHSCKATKNQCEIKTNVCTSFLACVFHNQIEEGIKQSCLHRALPEATVLALLLVAMSVERDKIGVWDLVKDTEGFIVAVGVWLVSSDCEIRVK